MGVVCIAGIDQVVLLVTIHDPVRPLARSLGRRFFGLGGAGFTKKP